MNTNTSTTPTPARRGESVVQAVIMLAVAGMAGAASFTHVHDWTMHNSPAGTGNWFGWANAMVSELIPLAAGLEARRRIRHYGTAGAYPIVLIVAAVALSLTGQFAEATHSISGWLISAVPALGFLALVKLVLSSPRPTTSARHRPTSRHPTTSHHQPLNGADTGDRGRAPARRARRSAGACCCGWPVSRRRIIMRRPVVRSPRRSSPPGFRSRRRSRRACCASSPLTTRHSRGSTGTGSTSRSGARGEYLPRRGAACAAHVPGRASDRIRSTPAARSCT